MSETYFSSKDEERKEKAMAYVHRLAEVVLEGLNQNYSPGVVFEGDDTWGINIYIYDDEGKVCGNAGLKIRPNPGPEGGKE